jgi:phospholipase A1
MSRARAAGYAAPMRITHALAATVCAIAPQLAAAASPERLVEGPSDCRRLADPDARLACYDRVFGDPVPAESDDLAVDAAGSALTRFWELDAAGKRGTFHVLTWQPNFVLPVNFGSDMNQAPSSPTQPVPSGLPEYDDFEALVQLSIRAKIAEDLLLPGGDLWFGYTHRIQWQVWNGDASRPFRNTDYEPELFYVAPIPARMSVLPGGWRWRLAQVGIGHQSNGQTDPLSRSWNRLSGGVAVERGRLSLQARYFWRLQERDDDDNPDLMHYMGRTELRATWWPGVSITTLTWRTNFDALDRGSLTFDFSYPMNRDNPEGLRWYLRAFHGFGESLLDYNFRKTSVGAGVMLFAF